MQYCGIMYLHDYINDVTHIVILLRQHVQTHCLPEIQCCDIFLVEHCFLMLSAVREKKYVKHCGGPRNELSKIGSVSLDRISLSMVPMGNF